ncbi:hypothetical protein [Thermosyntropha sp.]|uniref:hypothetical protein n=1 Tax=Thermosyntropha sp. TaxID=2740820 RepID=UPI0025D8237B|nr:hypothetical protein [Thermosyntropha sp.]MBO8157959.1 hypothetical protein [Thermosyntropha sp.]
MPTPSAQAALDILRDSSQFQWYVIPLLAITMYIYALEAENNNWNGFFAGLAFWGMDWFNEIWNGLVFHFTQYAPVWGAPGQTAFLILIGLNIEICFMFAIAGIGWSKLLLKDKHARILGIPNRWFIAVIGSLFCVAVEMGLNFIGALTWNYSWWCISAPWLIFLVGYLPFFLVAFWVYDMDSIKKKAITVTSIFTVDILCLITFGGILGWI